VSVKQHADSGVKQAIPFFGVRDIEVSVKYYVDGLGFTMTNKWEPNGRLRWCMLRIGEANIMLQEFLSEGTHANVPSEKLGVGVTISFQCADAIALYRDAKSRGVEASVPFVGNSMWVTSMSDPDGYRLEFESPTDVPEETVYDEQIH
jgi:predicted lactoylglutathione lyase